MVDGRRSASAYGHGYAGQRSARLYGLGNKVKNKEVSDVDVDG